MVELRTPCEVCGLYEEGEHFDQVGDWCDGAGSRKATVSDLVEALQEVGEVLWWTPHRGLIERHKGHLWEDEGPIVDGELSPVDRDGHWVLVVPLGEDV